MYLIFSKLLLVLQNKIELFFTAIDKIIIPKSNCILINVYIYIRQVVTVTPFVVSGIEDLCNKRDELQKQILTEEEEKCKIQNDLRILTERLARINESLAKKIASRNEYDKTIAETEAAYMKVMHEISYAKP